MYKWWPSPIPFVAAAFFFFNGCSLNPLSNHDRLMTAGDEDANQLNRLLPGASRWRERMRARRVLKSTACLFLTLAITPQLHADEAVPPLSELLKLYNELDLPLPPKNAKLVTSYVRGGDRGNGVKTPVEYGLAFKTTPHTGDTPYILQRGVFIEERNEAWRPGEIDPNRDAANNVDTSWFGLTVAIQCHARGWNELADILYKKSLANTKRPPRKEICFEAWFYWMDQLSRPQTDRTKIVQRLKALMAREKELDLEANRALLESMISQKAKPGTIAAQIDELVWYRGTTGTNQEFIKGISDEEYLRVAELGFEAVPALINYLGDRRVTQGKMQGFNNFPTFNLNVENIASDLLDGLAGQELKFDWLKRQKGYTVDKVDVIRWWLKANQGSEEAYLVDHFLDSDEYSGGSRGARIRRHRLILLKAKYPSRIPDLYQTAMKKNPGNENYGLFEAVLASSLPDKDKATFCIGVLKGKDSQHYAPAFAAVLKSQPGWLTAFPIP
ncbi:hypothetical protein BH10PLA2_BH10PLA2_20820 [soil metagenome]